MVYGNRLHERHYCLSSCVRKLVIHFYSLLCRKYLWPVSECACNFTLLLKAASSLLFSNLITNLTRRAVPFFCGSFTCVALIVTALSLALFEDAVNVDSANSANNNFDFIIYCVWISKFRLLDLWHLLVRNSPMSKYTFLRHCFLLYGSLLW